jgi:hypothetical protein
VQLAEGLASADQRLAGEDHDRSVLELTEYLPVRQETRLGGRNPMR